MTDGVVAFENMDAPDAIAACTPLPSRLLLRHAVSTRADRASRAQRRIWLDLLIGLAPAVGIVLAARWAGAGDAAALGAGAAALAVWTIWRYWRRNSDPAWLFELEEWIDFGQRVWHSQKRHLDAPLPPVAEAIPLDALMLLCAWFRDAEGGSFEFGLCKIAGFDPTAEALPARIDFLCSAPTEPEAIAFATAIARSWGIACWMHSAASDQNSTRLC